jgi:predicted ArsR family transcriptional regulator
MFKIAHHPKAFLTLKRNIQPGLSARTQILSVLEKRICDAKTISKEIGLSYAVVLYHLHLLEAENILNRRGRRSYVWQLTGVGQQRLIGGKEAKPGIRRAPVHT